ncbi:MAG: methyl-accepting chemotaxis protein [Lachnospiraceae bacterium]|jgi:methyl-accepting chemotaxis protein|nr:methyl-accepting chemotaxis protein [Lachnospiraceae bacterium]
MEKKNQVREKRGMVSIRMKLLAIIVPIVVALMVALVLIAYQTSAKIIESYSRNLLESSVGSQSSHIEGWLNENIEAFQAVKATIESIKPQGDKLQAILDAYYDYNSNYPQGMYIADEDGNMFQAAGASIDEPDPVNSTWYQEGLTRVNMAVGSAYVNSQGENVISASGILNDGSGKVKVISADMTLDRISIIVNGFIDMEGAESFLIDGRDGTILANRDNALISTKMGDSGNAFQQQVGKKITERDYGFSVLEGNMTVFEKVTGTDWVLVSFVPRQIVMADLIRLRNIMALISIASILVLCMVIERVTHIVINPVKKLTKVITAMTDGDFTVSVSSKGNDEIAVMSRSVERFIRSMKEMIASMGDISGRLGSQADTSDNMSRQMQSAAAIQSESMGELNHTVDQLSLSVYEIAENATKLAGVVADTKSDSDSVEHKMRETVEASQKGKRDMERVGRELENIQGSIRSLEEAVGKVGAASGEIVAIVQLIGNIAEETNLLSLNASIEAARAGEAGRGFAVVASEIGTLANNSTDSVEHISKLIGQVNALVADAVRQTGDSADDISRSSGLIHEAIETFEKIFVNIQETSEMIGHMVGKINEVDEVAANVAAISEEQAASSDEILATSENMLEQAKGIAQNSAHVAEESKSLTASSEELAEQVKLFRI